jgi:hypothetical protein
LLLEVNLAILSKKKKKNFFFINNFYDLGDLFSFICTSGGGEPCHVVIYGRSVGGTTWPIA